MAQYRHGYAYYDLFTDIRAIIDMDIPINTQQQTAIWTSKDMDMPINIQLYTAPSQNELLLFSCY